MKQKVALVLSGGGARGVAHIGVIEELEKQGFEITSVAGTSIGALIGGTYVLGKMEVYKNWLCTLDKMKVFSMVDFTLSGQGLVKGDKVIHKMRELVEDANIEDLKIPYVALAADIIHKKEVVFRHGSIIDAIRASIAIPTVFTPVKWETGLLVDGGILNNLPINHVKRHPGDILIAVNVNADTPCDKPPVPEHEVQAKHSSYHEKVNHFYSHLRKIHPKSHEEKFGYFNVINKTITLITHHTTQMSLEKYSPDVLINVSHDACGNFDFYKAEEMIEMGRHSAAKSLEAYKNKITV
jgi:NTE family protein